jgi:hypothetical protein
MLASQTWLLGYEFPSTFIAFFPDQITFICSASKGSISIPCCPAPSNRPIADPNSSLLLSRTTCLQTAKILNQLNADGNAPIKLNILAKGKDAASAGSSLLSFPSSFLSKRELWMSLLTCDVCYTSRTHPIDDPAAQRYGLGQETGRSHQGKAQGKVDRRVERSVSFLS